MGSRPMSFQLISPNCGGQSRSRMKASLSSGVSASGPYIRRGIHAGIAPVRSGCRPALFRVWFALVITGRSAGRGNVRGGTHTRSTTTAFTHWMIADAKRFRDAVETLVSNGRKSRRLVWSYQIICLKGLIKFVCRRAANMVPRSSGDLPGTRASCTLIARVHSIGANGCRSGNADDDSGKRSGNSCGIACQGAGLQRLRRRSAARSAADPAIVHERNHPRRKPGSRIESASDRRALLRCVRRPVARMDGLVVG